MTAAVLALEKNDIQSAYVDLLTVEQRDLSEAIARASKFALKARTTQGALNGLGKIHLQYEAGSPYLHVSAWNGDAGIEETIPASGGRSLDVYVDPKFTGSIVRKLLDKPVTIEVDNNSIVLSQGPYSKRRIAFQDIEEPAQFPVPDANLEIITLETTELIEAALACSIYLRPKKGDDESEVQQLHQTNVELRWSPGEFAAAATDTRAFGTYKVSSGAKKEHKVLIPGQLLEAFSQVVRKIKPDYLDVIVDEAYVIFTAMKSGLNVARLCSRSSIGDIGPVGKLLEMASSNPKGISICDRLELLGALDRLSPVANLVPGKHISFETKQGSVVIKVPRSIDGQNAMEVISAELNGEMINGGLNLEYFMTLLKSMDAPLVQIMYGSHDACCAIFPHTDTPKQMGGIAWIFDRGVPK